MKIATIVFTYNRSYHTGRVLSGLKNGEVRPEKLYIFQDGLKKEEHRTEWEKVKEVIHETDWCDTEIIESNINKGLANSICDGINYVFKEYDAIVVLEDDCVPHYKFMTYMLQALNKYEKCIQIHSVSGYSNAVSVPRNGMDAYFTRRAESIGWGTWKDRWQQYRIDYRMVYKIKSNPKLEREYHIWGADLETYLHGNIDGKCNSWAVFWSLLAIEKEQYCLAPYESLIDNIGFDGTGVHSGDIPIKQILRDPENKNDILLPDRIEFPENYAEIFSHFFATTTKEEKLLNYNSVLSRWVSVGEKYMLDYLKQNNISNIAIWGAGKICDLLIEKLSKDVYIRYIIKSTAGKNEIYNGVPVIELENLDKQIDLIIIVPIYDIDNIIYQYPELQKYRYIGIDKLIG